jgi:hypothetical protein
VNKTEISFVREFAFWEEIYFKSSNRTAKAGYFPSETSAFHAARIN